MDTSEIILTAVVLVVIVLAIWVARMHVELGVLREAARSDRGTGTSLTVGSDEWAKREVVAWEYVASNIGRIADAMSAYAPPTLEYAPGDPANRRE